MNKKTIRDIVIVGGGTAGWMTAAAIAKVMGTQAHTITLVESELIGTVGVGEATIPMIQLYNNVLGIDEDEFVRETNATFKLGIEFVDWRRRDHTYFHPFGLYGIDMDGIAFQHFWLRWAKSGGNVDWGRFNAETEAARQRKFMRTPDQGPNPLAAGVLPRINYAFQFDASLYAAYLRKFSEKRGAVRVEGMVERVVQNPQTGFIEALELKDGRTIKGDFFIDCTGFRGLLIEQTLQAGFEDWSEWLPCDRAWAVPCDKVEDPTPYTRATAREAGWQWRIPLQHRTGNGYVFSTKFISEDEARNKLMSRLDGAPQAEPRMLKFTAGRRRKSWVKNCVAFGLSSGFLEPLESTSIHLIQFGIAKLLAMFPRDSMDPILIERFNAELEFEYTTIRDFIIAHYKVTDRDDTPFWAYCKNMEVPKSLSDRLELFRSRGEVLTHYQELFKEVNWFSVLMGQGLVPDNYHPTADVITDDELRLRLARIRTRIQDRVNGMPPHQQFIDRNCSATAPLVGA
jgi:tryptophan halogenase